MSGPTDRIAYTFDRRRYIRVTNRCSLDCTFCSRNAAGAEDRRWTLDPEPAVDEMVAAAGDPRAYRTIVFTGPGEPTLRLYDMLDAAQQIRHRGGVIRIDTNGLANLVHGRDITPDLEDIVDALSVSLNAQDSNTYDLYCRPMQPNSYVAVLDFIERASLYVPDITLTAVDGLPKVDLEACRRLASRVGARFALRQWPDVVLGNTAT